MLLGKSPTLLPKSGYKSLQESQAIGNSHFVHVPYDSFKTKDGHIILAIITDGLWEKFIRLIELPHLDTEENKTQPGRWKNRDLIMNDVAECLLSQPNSIWLERLQQNGIPCAPVNTFEGALQDPHVLSRDMVVNVQHPNGESVKQVGNPIKLSEFKNEEFKAPPLLGQDTDEVFKSLLGLDEGDLSKLKGEGIIQ